ncbi:MAG: hypothetical protein PHW02_02445 [bacterium]|nr:hypothetical protein [bacterium]
MRYYIYANTIADSLAKANKQIFKEISSALNKDVLYCQQRFIGKGFAKILSFAEGEEAKAEEARERLKKLKIESIVIDREKTSKRAEECFKTASIEEYDDRFRFIDVKGNDLYIDKESDILVIGGIDNTFSSADTLKKLSLSDIVQIYIYSSKAGRLIEINNRTVNYSKIRNASKYSKTENLNKLLLELKKRGSKYKENFLYNSTYVPEISPSLKIYSSVASFMFENGMYESEYAEEFFDPGYVESEKNLAYDFKYDIYRPGELSRKTRPVKKLNLAQNAALPIIPAVFIAAISFRTQANILLIICSFALFAYYAYHFFSILKMKLFFESIPFSKIKSMSVGLNEVKGIVIDRNAIPSPISGIKAVYFRYSKYRKVKTEKDNEEWKLVEVGEYVPASFFIDCDGDSLEIKTMNSSINLHSSSTYHKTHYEFFCMEDSDKVKFVEEILPVSAEVFVLGSAVYSDREKELESFIKNRKADRDFINTFDEDKDKFIDESEWAKAKQAMEHEFDEKETRKKEHEHLSMQYTKDDNILFISDMSESSMLRRFTLFLVTTAVLGLMGLVTGIILLWR